MNRAPGIWSDSSRVALCNFVENIKIAYESKDSAYFENTFKLAEYIPKEIAVERNRYFNQLKECFKSKDKVKIEFNFFYVVRLSHSELYGINLGLGYHCKEMTDQGYLFVLLDVNNPQEPEIKFCVWQKERDPKLTPDYEKDEPFYGLYNGTMM